jgi:hypothetical protein
MIGVIFLRFTHSFYNLIKLGFIDDGIDKADVSVNGDGTDPDTFYDSTPLVIGIKSDEQSRISFETCIPICDVFRSHVSIQCCKIWVEIYNYLLVFIEKITISAYIQIWQFLTGLKCSAFQRSCACTLTTKLNRCWSPGVLWHLASGF